MVRLFPISFACLTVLGCAGHESASASGETRTQPEAEACEGLLLADDLSLRQTAQGSHGSATTDISIDLKTGKMSGTDYKLDTYGDTPIVLAVDQQASPEALAALRQRFENTCAPRRKVETQEHSAPGGSSMMQVQHADGSLLFITGGAANLPPGATVADVEREDWRLLFAAWPLTEGKFDSDEPPA